MFGQGELQSSNYYAIHMTLNKRNKYMTKRWNNFYNLTFAIVNATSLDSRNLVINILRKDELISMEKSDLSFLLDDYYIIELFEHITDNLCLNLIYTFHNRIWLKHIDRIQPACTNFKAILNLYQLSH